MEDPESNAAGIVPLALIAVLIYAVVGDGAAVALAIVGALACVLGALTASGGESDE